MSADRPVIGESFKTPYLFTFSFHFLNLRMISLSVHPVALPLLCFDDMSRSTTPNPDDIRRAIEAYFAERHAYLLPNGEETRDGRRFSWCGDVLDFLTEGLPERLAAQGITFSKSFPGPFRLMDEDQSPNGDHVRRFWTTALAHGCPIARLCTAFFHRHDRVELPRPPKVEAFPPDLPEPEAEP